MTDHPPTLRYWHVWTDGDGVSHQTLAALTRFTLKGMSGAAPQWQDILDAKGAALNFSVLPVGWVGEWHQNPAPQWIIPLSGAWLVETMDGQSVTMGPGEISFGEDQNCRPDARGRKGHFSRTVGDQPCVMAIVQMDVAPTINEPGRFT